MRAPKETLFSCQLWDSLKNRGNFLGHYEVLESFEGIFIGSLQVRCNFPVSMLSDTLASPYSHKLW